MVVAPFDPRFETSSSNRDEAVEHGNKAWIRKRSILLAQSCQVNTHRLASSSLCKLPQGFSFPVGECLRLPGTMMNAMSAPPARASPSASEPSSRFSQARPEISSPRSRHIRWARRSWRFGKDGSTPAARRLQSSCYRPVRATKLNSECRSSNPQSAIVNLQ